MASGAGIEIETWAEAIGNGFHFSECWYPMSIEKVEFPRGQTGDRLACARRSAANSGVARLSLRGDSHE
jgi:hypothetical protein